MIVSGVVRGRLALLRSRLWTRSDPVSPASPALPAPAGARRLRPRAGAVSAAVWLVLAALLAWAMAHAFGFLRAAGHGQDDARTLLAWLFTTALLGVLVFDLHEALAVLVAAPDLDLLRAAPLSPRALAALRLLDALPRSLPLVLALALPAAIGFVAACGEPAAGFAGAALALAALWLAPLGLGVALALPVARLLPPARARDLLGLLSTFALVAAWLANALLVPRTALEALSSGRGQVIAALPAPPAWLPSAWAAEAFATERPDVAALAGLAFSALAGAVLAWWATRRHLEAALERTQDVPRRVPAATGRRVAPNLTAAFLARDVRLFGRQWTVAADVIAASLLWMLLPLLSLPLVPVGDAQLARAMLVLLAVGIGYEVGARALALERGALAWSHLAPSGPTRWVLGRLAGVGVLALAMLVPAGAAVAIGFRLPAHALPGLAEWALSAAAVSVAVGLLTGAAFADAGWSHPRAMLSVAGRLAGTLLLLLQVALWLGLDAWELALPPGLLLVLCLSAAAAFLVAAGHALARRSL